MIKTTRICFFVNILFRKLQTTEKNIANCRDTACPDVTITACTRPLQSGSEMNSNTEKVEEFTC